MAATEVLIVRQAKAMERIKAALGDSVRTHVKGPSLLRHTQDLESIADALETNRTAKTERKEHNEREQ